MKLLLLTTSLETLKWKSLPTKLSAIHEALGKSWTVTIEHTGAKPLIVKGRVDHAWYKNFIKDYLGQGFDVVALHLSNKQRKEWDLETSLRGSNIVSNDFYGDFYFWADENTKRQGWDQFTQTSMHELSHEYFQKTKLKDITHEYHDKNKNILPLIKSFDWNLYKTKTQGGKVSFLKSLIMSLMPKTPSTLLHPVEKYQNYVSQAYGVPNALYKLTGRHIGTDYACPIGTEVLAPWNGRITTAGTGAATGNFCHYEYTFNGQKYEERWCHLKAVPTIDEYQRGDIVAITGNTGMSTGPHLHREKWLNDVRVDLINKTNWANLTVDPQK